MDRSKLAKPCLEKCWPPLWVVGCWSCTRYLHRIGPTTTSINRLRRCFVPLRSPPASPLFSCPLTIFINAHGGLEKRTSACDKPANSSPPIYHPLRRASKLYAQRVIARRCFDTSSDVRPLWRAYRLRSFALLCLRTAVTPTASDFEGVDSCVPT